MKLAPFLKKEIWHVQLTKLPKWKAYCYRFLRILLLIHRGFTKSQITQGASSLTYYSLLAVVPIIAMLIGVARGFEFEKTLEAWLLRQFSEQQEIIKNIFKFANTSLQQANGGVIAGIGILILIWSAINILMNIEYVMNRIWEIDKGRSLKKQMIDYMAMLFLAPLVIFLSSGLPGYISAFIAVLKKGKVLADILPFLIFLVNAFSFFLNALVFTFIYIFIPNTRVRFTPALIAGIFTAFFYQVIQWIYFYFQIGVSEYNAIYGTFAAFPLFLIWLHLSWVIVLLGAKLSFSIQNVDSYEFITEEVKLSRKIRMICALRIAHLCIKAFDRELTPPSAIEISNNLSIPLMLVRQLLQQLIRAKILIEVKRGQDQEECYQPALSIERLTIKKVIDMLNESGETIPLPPSHEVSQILDSLKKFSAAIESSDGNILLRNI